MRNLKYLTFRQSCSFQNCICLVVVQLEVMMLNKSPSLFPIRESKNYILGANFLYTSKFTRTLLWEQFFNCIFFLRSIFTFDFKLIGPDPLWKAGLLKAVISIRK